jgi:hypothetical protein
VSGALIGQAIGYYFGGPWGAMIGGMIGGALFDKGADGPRLGDLKPQASEYGRPITIVYGTAPVAGNVIWASDLIELPGEGGKGGGAEGYVYHANFAVSLCEGERTLGRIWAGPEKRLIWDGATLEGADAGAVKRFYSGSETQLPDPLMESHLGVGNVPAYRGTAYLVLENFPLTNDGNRIPFLWVEVGAATETAPEQLGIVFTQQTMVFGEYYAVFYWGSYYGIVIRRLNDQKLFAHYVYSSANWHVGAQMFLDQGRQRFIRPNIGTLSFSIFSITNGALTTQSVTAAAGAEANPGAQIFGGCYHNGYYIFAAKGSPGETSKITLYLIDPDTFTPVATYTPNPGTGTPMGPVMAPITASPYVYVFSHPQKLTRLGLALASPPIDVGTPAQAVSEAVNYVARDPNTGYLWSMRPVGGTDLEVVVSNGTSNIYSATIAFPATIAKNPFTFVPAIGVHPNRLIVSGEQWLAMDYFVTFNATTPGIISSGTGGYHGISKIDAMLYNPTTYGIQAVRDGGWITFGSPDDPATTVNFLKAGSFDQEEDNKYLGEADGTIIPQGQALSEVVLDLSKRAGLAASKVDVTQLANIKVDGYAIASQTSVRDAVMALAPAFYFDAVESDGKAKFVKRGGAIAVVIGDDELGAYESGSEAPDPLQTVRKMDEEMPRILNAKYMLEASKYDQAVKIAKRLVGNSGDEQSMEMPLVLTDTRAQEVAEVNLHALWVSRISYKFSLPLKYAYLEPTDIIVVRGRTMLLRKITHSGGRCQCEAVQDDSNLYTPHVDVTETPPPPAGEGGSVATPPTTVLELM